MLKERQYTYHLHKMQVLTDQRFTDRSRFQHLGSLLSDFNQRFENILNWKYPTGFWNPFQVLIHTNLQNYKN